MSACPACAAQLPDGLAFCRECGTPLRRTCPACGASDEPGRFCGRCGAPLGAPTTAPSPADPASPSSPAAVPVVPVAERRVTSVLFADIVGFTPFSESRDAEEVREMLSRYFARCRAVIDGYGGVVEKFIGDAVMAVWGVPVAHEDDAVRAVRAGLDLASAVTELGEEIGAGLAVRVGIVTGEVAVTVGATAEGMVAGDAVNTAARVQSVAAPGRVWVNDATRLLASGAVAFEPAGEHELKGKAGPVRLWQAGEVLAGLDDWRARDGLEAPLTGRDADLSLLTDLFHGVEAAGRPRLVVLDGEAGIGKSRLVQEFETYVDRLATTTRWHRGRCLPYGDGVAFRALAEAFRVRLGITEADPPDAVRRRLDERLEELVTDPSERDWLRPRLAVLLGQGDGPVHTRGELFAAWTAFLEHLAAGGSTVVLVIDDAQYADDGLLDFVEHLLSSARAPQLVLELARPDLLLRRPDITRRRAALVRLEPLPDPAMAALVDGLVRGLPGTARDTLVERAEGIPLFAVETVRALVDRGVVEERDGHLVPAAGVDVVLATMEAPVTLQALVAARLDALSAEERRVVADASVLGQTFTRDALVALGTDPGSLEPVLASLLRKEILAVQTDRFTVDHGQLRFVQSVVRQVAYRTQSRRDRKARHVAAAEHLAALPDPGGELAVVVAQHLLDAVDAALGGDPDVPDLASRACVLLERAAVRARSLGAPADAVRLLRTALDRTTEPVARARTALAAAEAANDAADYAAARVLAAESARLHDTLGDPVRAGAAAACEALALASVGENAEAIAVAEPRWRALVDVDGAAPALVALARVLASASSVLGDVEAQGRYAERRLRVAESLGDPAAVASATSQLGAWHAMVGRPEVARALFEHASSTSREHDLPGPLAFALTSLGSLLNGRDLPAALGFSADAIEASRRAGQRFYGDYATGNLLIGLWLAGRYDDARTRLATAWDTVTDPVVRLWLATIEVWLADALGEDAPQREPAADNDSERARAWSDSARVVRLSRAGEAGAAARLAAETFDRVVSVMGVDDDFVALWPPLVLAALGAGDADLAERMLQPVADAPGDTVADGVAAQWQRLRALVAVRRGAPADRVEADLRASVDALERFGALGSRAQAQEELARWLVDVGRPRDAVPLLADALAAYDATGATGWRARLVAWLDARPELRGPVGVDRQRSTSPTT